MPSRRAHGTHLPTLLAALLRPQPASELTAALGISQSALSRLLPRYRDEVLTTGRARATRYAARRVIPDVGRSVPIYELDEKGGSRRAATLHAVRPGFYVEAHAADVDGGFFVDLPWFLHEMRPAGFLGRAIGRAHPELGLPVDVDLWTADQTLRFLAPHGWNMPGAFIVGEEAFRLHIERAQHPNDGVEDGTRARRYPEIAQAAMASGDPGSSAGGEQPKFLATRQPDGVACLVKFSPPTSESVGRRVADMLVAEHLALETLRDAHHEAPRSQVLEAGGRVFLEIERFDRLPGHGRRGVLSLFALDAEFSGERATWTDIAETLVARRRLDRAWLEAIRFRELFGRFIGNTDMHPGNLSFFARGTRAVGLAPAYDVNPAVYAPRGAEVVPARFESPRPAAADGAAWARAGEAGVQFWRLVARDPRIGAEFRGLALARVTPTERARDLGRLLPL